VTDDPPRPALLPVPAAAGPVALTAPPAAAPAPAVTVPAGLVPPVELVPVDDARVVAGVLPEVGVAGELVAHVLGELPALAVLEDRERLLAAAWLASLRSARTRRSYAADLLGWQAWLATRGLDVLAAGRVHLDLWVRAQQTAGAGDASVRRRLSGVGSFYRYCLVHGLVASDPTAGVARPRVDPDYTATVGLSREQGRALIAAADADPGRARLRSAAVIRLLLHNALRVDEVLGADIADLGTDRGHQVLTVVGKGNRRAKVPLTPATVVALHAYLDHRAALATGKAGLEYRSGAWRGMSGPLLTTTSGGRMRPGQLWELVRRLAHAAGIVEWDRLSAHSLRHTGITLALDAGVPLRDVQDYARHRDARTTRRYDHSRDSLDRSAAYAVAAYLS
jgi:site-specific recombinase XerD